MLSNKTVAWFSYASMVAMAIMLILMWQRMVPEQWYVTMFGVALALFLVRVTLRLILARQARLGKGGRESQREGEGHA
jgi:hypothetical protein